MDLEIRAETMAKSFDSTSISPQNHGMITVNTRQEVKRVTIKPTMKHLIPENIYDVKDRRKISVVVRHKWINKSKPNIPKCLFVQSNSLALKIESYLIDQEVVIALQ